MNDCITLKIKPKKSDGYVRIMRKGVRYYAHRYFYEQKFGKVSEGLELHHKCENRACVKIEHLKPVTHKENMSYSKNCTIKTGYCRKGHILAEVGIYIHPTSGPTCRECKRESVRRYRKRERLTK